MNEDTLAIWLIFGFMPLLGGIFAYLRWRRIDDLKRMAMGWGRHRGADHAGQPVPDGKTMIELEKLRLADRDKARQLFERLSLEKLELLKVSIQSGYKEEELARLDERLERIIGSDKLQRLLDESTEQPAARPAGTALPGPSHRELSSADLAPGPAESGAKPQSTSAV